MASGYGLIIVDMLNDFVPPGAILQCGERAAQIVEPIRQRIDEVRSEGGAIIYACDSHLPDDLEFAMFGPHAVRGSHGAQVVDELAPQEADRIVYKRRYSAFFGSELLLTLRELDIREVELAGVCTNICIYFTAQDARNLAYPVTVHAGRVATFDEAAHAFALGQMVSVLDVSVIR